MRVSGSKEVREEASILERLGFHYQGFDSSGHHVFDHPQHGEVVMASSPSSCHWRRNHRKTVAKAMGLNLVAVEALINGQPVGKRTVRRKPPGRKRARPLHLVKPAEPVPPAPSQEPAPVAYLPTDPWTSKRKKTAGLLQEANLAANARERLEAPFPWSTSRRSAA